MKKRLKKYGNTLIINFTKEEQKMYGLVEGDIIDVEDMVVEAKE